MYSEIIEDRGPRADMLQATQVRLSIHFLGMGGALARARAMEKGTGKAR